MLCYAAHMTKEQIESLLERVRHWPKPLQEEAVEMLLAIEAMGDRPLYSFLTMNGAVWSAASRMHAMAALLPMMT